MVAHRVGEVNVEVTCSDLLVPGTCSIAFVFSRRQSLRMLLARVWGEAEEFSWYHYIMSQFFFFSTGTSL